jgi:replicative DNA helicase
VSVKDRAKLSQYSLDEILTYGSSKPADVRTFISDLRKASHSRHLDSALAEAHGLIKAGEDPYGVIEKLEARLYGSQLSGGQDSQDSADVAEEAVKRFLERVSGGGERYLSTGFRDLDKALLGYLRGQNIVVGARPGNGKSAFACTTAISTLEQGEGVIVFSREMTAQELMVRWLSGRSGVGVRKIKRGTDVTQEEIAKVVEAGKTGFPRHLLKVNTKCQTLKQIARVVRMERARMERNGIRLGMVIIDYLQLFCESEDNQVIGQASKECKLIAMDNECTVITLSQLNRSLEYREDKTPLPSDLRGSGSIEQDADVILFLFRPWVYDKQLDEEYCQAIVAKQRDGPQGPVPIRFLPKLTLFTDWNVPDTSPPVPGVDTGPEGTGHDGGPQTEAVSVQLG